MTHYIYLTILRVPNKHPLYYVGMHHWEGEGLDKTYYGSSSLILKTIRQGHKDWLQCRVITYIDKDSIYYMERHFINKCLHKHGAYYRGTSYKGIRRYWLDPYGKGHCINAQLGYAEHMRSHAQAKDVRQRAALLATITNRANGNLDYLVKSSHTKKAIAKMVTTRVSTGITNKCAKAMHAVRSESDYANQALINNSHRDYSKTKLRVLKRRNFHYTIRCIQANIIGSVQYVTEQINHPEIRVWLSRRFAEGHLLAERLGFKFELIERTGGESL